MKFTKDFGGEGARREMLFKDAVLSAAEAKSMKLLTDAQAESARQLQAAREGCPEADECRLEQSFKRDAERRRSAAAQKAHRELLLRRAQLEDELFRDVRARLEAFAKSRGYAAFLAARAAKCAADGQGGPPPVVLLRPCDMRHAAAIRKKLPGCEVRADETIDIGGPKVVRGRRLYDETLDAALSDERQAFARGGAFTLAAGG